MTSINLKLCLILAAVSSALVFGCGPFNVAVTIPDATINVQPDGDISKGVEPDRDVQLNLNVTNVVLVEPGTTPPAGKEKEAGHVQIYLDDYNAPPLVITAQTTVTVKIPKETKQGKHKLLCRVHKHDGTPTTTVFEVEVTVTVSTTTTTDAGVAP